MCMCLRFSLESLPKKAFLILGHTRSISIQNPMSAEEREGNKFLYHKIQIGAATVMVGTFVNQKQYLKA